MSLVDIIAKLQEQLVALQALQDSQPQFSQADLDAAVQVAVGPLNVQIVDLQAQVVTIPEQLHQAALAEDAVLAEKVKALLDQLVPPVV